MFYATNTDLIYSTLAQISQLVIYSTSYSTTALYYMLLIELCLPVHCCIMNNKDAVLIINMNRIKCYTVETSLINFYIFLTSFVLMGEISSF